jgi:hypothetical protein
MGMADQIMGRAHQFGLGEAANIYKRLIDKSNLALGIGPGNQQSAVRQFIFFIGYWTIISNDILRKTNTRFWKWEQAMGLSIAVKR